MTARRRHVGSECENLLNPVNERRQFSNETSENKYSNINSLTSQSPLQTIMTSRDRTNEFKNAICTLQGRQLSKIGFKRDSKQDRDIQSHRDFMLIARTIGKNISSTYTKLEKLTLLAKRKGLFNDRPSEIQELTYIIKEDLNSLNQQIARLQEVSRAQRQSQSNGKHLISHSSNVVLTLQSKLASMSTEFKQVLEVRTENLKQQKNRRDHFSQGSISSSLPPSAMALSPSGSLLLAENHVSVNMDMVPLMQQQKHLIYDETDNYLQSRAETMQKIESTIVELGGIYQQLAHMVKEQEEMVERIDANVQDTEMNVEAAHGEILKYFQSITSNRWLMIKIFGVLILFFIFFVVFLA